ncbi:MAG: hypothetical protein RLZZ106_1406, partial [Cyanobacteriota bacterium]
MGGSGRGIEQNGAAMPAAPPGG